MRYHQNPAPVIALRPYFEITPGDMAIFECDIASRRNISFQVRADMRLVKSACNLSEVIGVDGRTLMVGGVSRNGCIGQQHPLGSGWRRCRRGTILMVSGSMVVFWLVEFKMLAAPENARE